MGSPICLLLILKQHSSGWQVNWKRSERCVILESAAQNVEPKRLYAS